MIVFLLNLDLGGGHDLQMDRGMPPDFHKGALLLKMLSYPFLCLILVENYPFITIFCKFHPSPSMVEENLPKRTEFWTQKSTNMGGTCLYHQHAMWSHGI